MDFTVGHYMQKGVENENLISMNRHEKKIFIAKSLQKNTSIFIIFKIID